ncbi:hypothetical protein HMSSN139_67480 [Paenibacillus sp. HMSSN-139]|nr:hypothetical protein HMSSN139_67480 [Paenibacillus sp. HMSSN-139]
MTREEILNRWDGMKPWERDSWIFYDVLGRMPLDTAPNEYGGFGTIPKYTQDISAAWEVEERMNADELFWRYTNHVKKLLLSKMSEGVNEYDMMHAPPEIRCKAALLAVLAVLGEEE